MKATCYVVLIAILLVDFAWQLFSREQFYGKMSKLGLRVILLLCGYLLAFCCRNSMYDTLHYVPNPDMEMTWSNYFYNGLNEETTGACSGDGLSIAEAYAEYPGSFRRSVELHYAKDRILEKGVFGMLDFWRRKQVMNFNDGTFSWFQEGFFNAWEYENITESQLKEPLRDFYWEEGTGYIKFTTWSQGIWIFILLGIIFEAISVIVISRKADEDREMLCIRTIGVVIFIGVFLFVMLFEGRARYLLNYTPVFLVMAVAGYSELCQSVCGLFHSRRSE